VARPVCIQVRPASSQRLCNRQSKTAMPTWISPVQPEPEVYAHYALLWLRLAETASEVRQKFGQSNATCCCSGCSTPACDIHCDFFCLSCCTAAAAAFS
jgi:hypothetical protein